jgi:hypothetical protein
MKLRILLVTTIFSCLLLLSGILKLPVIAALQI